MLKQHFLCILPIFGSFNFQASALLEKAIVLSIWVLKRQRLAPLGFMFAEVTVAEGPAHFLQYTLDPLQELFHLLVRDNSFPKGSKVVPNRYDDLCVPTI